MEIVFERRLGTWMRRSQRSGGPKVSNELCILDLAREREAVEQGDETSPRESRHRWPFEFVNFGQLLAELETVSLGRELAGARNDLIYRDGGEAPLGIFVLAGEGFLFLSVA